MNHELIKTVQNLFEALHQANLADVPADEEQANDLPATAHGQENAFGHIAEAIKSLGFNEAYLYYCRTGEIPQNLDTPVDTLLDPEDGDRHFLTSADWSHAQAQLFSGETVENVNRRLHQWAFDVYNESASESAEAAYRDSVEI